MRLLIILIIRSDWRRGSLTGETRKYARKFARFVGLKHGVQLQAGQVTGLVQAEKGGHVRGGVGETIIGA